MQEVNYKDGSCHQGDADHEEHRPQEWFIGLHEAGHPVRSDRVRKEDKEHQVNQGGKNAHGNPVMPGKGHEHLPERNRDIVRNQDATGKQYAEYCRYIKSGKPDRLPGGS